MPQRSDVMFRTALADRLAAQSVTPRTQQIQSPGEGLANMGTMLANAWGAKNIRAGVDEDTRTRAQALAKALAGGDPAKEAQIIQTIGNSPDLVNAAATAQFNSMLNPKEQYEPITDANGNIVAQRSTKTGQVVVDPRAPKQRESKLLTQEELAQQLKLKAAGREDSGSGGPFAGKGMDAQTYNILLNGDPNSPVYRAAYAHVAQPRVMMDPNNPGMITTVSPDMSAFRKPGGGAPPAASAPQSTGAIPTVTPPPMPGGPTVAPDAAIKVPGAVVTQTPGGQPTKFTDVQGKAAGYADRLAQAEKVMSGYEKEGRSMLGQSLENVWGGNYLQSPAYQKFEQARRDIVNAILRPESGAVINPDEFNNAVKQYFPQPGDSDAVIRQKKENRRIKYEALAREAGPAYKPSVQPYAAPAGGVPPPPPGFQIMDQ